MAKRHERTLARRMALMALYRGMLLSDEPGSLALDCLDDELPDQGELSVYALQLLDGVQEHLQELDEKLNSVAQNWTVERMPVVDHAIMCLATYEMLYQSQVPISVCISEAVELAKEFGGQDDSARFTNGVLGRIARTYTSERIDSDEAIEQASAEPIDMLTASFADKIEG